jgi:hypothetical protein
MCDKALKGPKISNAEIFLSRYSNAMLTVNSQQRIEHDIIPEEKLLSHLKLKIVNLMDFKMWREIFLS